MVSTSGSAGCPGLMRIVGGRFKEVGSRMSWVKWVWFGRSKMGLLGKNLEILLSSSGVNLPLVSVVALQRVRR